MTKVTPHDDVTAGLWWVQFKGWRGVGSGIEEFWQKPELMTIVGVRPFLGYEKDGRHWVLYAPEEVRFLHKIEAPVTDD